MTVHAPSCLIIAAPASGAGKTTFACALMRALSRRGLRVRAAKVGPDYIDPMFHEQVVGVPSCNLDLFFSDERQIKRLMEYGEDVADILVIEGAMGLYDGIGVSTLASAFDVAQRTCTPAVLVMDARGKSMSLVAELEGFQRFRVPSSVRGVVLNRCSPSLYPRLKAAIERETSVKALGFLPQVDGASFESRHLGLVAAAEVAGLQEKLDALADAVEESVDIDGLLEIAAPGRQIDVGDGGREEAGDGAPIVAVARDAAFCFYYNETFRLMERLGARLAFFSPLEDAALPEGACGLYLGGGYPELHTRELAENGAMRESILRAVRAGMPTIAECGGFLYLHERLEDAQGAAQLMVGLFPGTAWHTGKLGGRFGYIELTAQVASLLGPAGTTLRGHEFHYWESPEPGVAFVAQKPYSECHWGCVHATPTMYAGFPHIYWPSAPDAMQRFVDACRAFAAGQGAGAASGEASGAPDEGAAHGNGAPRA